MRNPFKSFFYFSRWERRGILVLTVIIFMAIAGEHIYLYRKGAHSQSYEDSLQHALAMQEYEAFKTSIRDNTEKEWAQRASTYDNIRKTAQLVPFDPNTADSSTLSMLGLPKWMARTIVRYREKGGKFRRAEDFKKIYGMTEEQYNTLLPYLRIPPEEEKKDTVRKAASLYMPPPPYKYPSGTVIALNRADTASLKMIPGIGSGIARLITGYRQQLGGFYRIEQLAEIRLDYQQLAAWFSIDMEDIRRINVNRASVERLYAHPYINFYQAKAIVEYRKKHGALTSLKPLALYEEFSEEDMEKIGHYVCFE